MSTFSPLDLVKVKCLISINRYTFYVDVPHLWLLCEMTTKNCANGPKLVLKDLCEKSFVRNVRLPNLDATIISLVFLITLLSCSSRFLRALKQNRAHSRRLYMLNIYPSISIKPQENNDVTLAGQRHRGACYGRFLFLGGGGEGARGRGGEGARGRGGEGVHISVIPTFILPGQFLKTCLSASSLVSQRRGQVLL